MEKYVGPAIAASLVAFIYLQARKNSLKETSKNCIALDSNESDQVVTNNDGATITILYGTCTGTAKVFADRLKNHLLEKLSISEDKILVKDTDVFDDSDFEKLNNIVLLICSTWSDGTAPARAQRLYGWLQDYATDFRVSKNHLEHLTYSVFGLGGNIYGENFCKAVIEMDGYLNELGARRLRNVVIGDDASDLENQFDLWKDDITSIMALYYANVLSYHGINSNNDEEDITTTNNNNTTTIADGNNKTISTQNKAINDNNINSTDRKVMSKNQIKKLKQKENKANGIVSSQYQPRQSYNTSTNTNNTNISNSSSCCKTDNSSSSSSSSSSSCGCGVADKTPEENSSSSCCKSNNNHTTNNTKKDSRSCCNQKESPSLVSASATVMTDGEENDSDELEEEDIINSNFVTYDLPSDDDDDDDDDNSENEIEEQDESDNDDDDDADDDGLHGSATIGGCGEGTESQIDMEDLGQAISNSHLNNTTNSTNTTTNKTANNTITDGNTPSDITNTLSTTTASNIVKVVKMKKIDGSIIHTSGSKYSKVKNGKSTNDSSTTAATGTSENVVVTSGGEREMVTKLQRKALNKEGYKIIGSHSAVKLCRWTKNQMRGRGGCYKHTFYGITSYQCMEATPSLACANKCVFCWRHHKNPVGTEWRWKTDDPLQIVDEAVLLHQAMINEFKGVPGVLPERLIEGYTVKHCALSLVGEPIMYPRINEMIQELHRRKISSFMVTNAQFPERIRDLHPVTQFYVSVDASTKDSLKAIDRPLFRDFWDRFINSLKELRRKQQRTVYRMTLVKDWNMDSLDGYVELIEMGQPDFIEIKAMTYCGKSDASSLTMQNVPWHREVCQYGEMIAMKLNERSQERQRLLHHNNTHKNNDTNDNTHHHHQVMDGIGGVEISTPIYNIATEHEHSCCILLAREDKFKPNGIWHTWINYEKFHELIQMYYTSNGVSNFSSIDYMEQTPDWALYKSDTHGFDPIENRWKRTKNGTMVEIEYKSSDSGCG